MKDIRFADGAMQAQQSGPRDMRPRGGYSAEESRNRFENTEILKKEIEDAMRTGAIPKDFDIKAAIADEAFLKLLFEMPVAYAVRVYAAESRAARAKEEAMENIATRIQAQKGLPQPSRANATGVQSRDYANMSSEEFARLERKFKELSRNGVRVKL